ncbi:MAG: endonuclease domain-containing protein [Bacteroidaceae bacterium]|nr:endonuclease domain-containing protein [Bacteroidaceae bacterium]
MNKPNFTYASPDRYQLLKEFANKNRKNQTPAENYFWRALKEAKFPISFKRQFIIGDYIADFANIDASIIVEIDGAYHCEPIQIENDAVRTAWLNRMGWHVIRFTNDEVLYDIKRVLNTLFLLHENIKNK